MTAKEMAEQALEASAIVSSTRSVGFHDRQLAYCTLASYAAPIARAFIRLYEDEGCLRSQIKDLEAERDWLKAIIVKTLDQERKRIIELDLSKFTEEEKEKMALICDEQALAGGKHEKNRKGSKR